MGPEQKQGGLQEHRPGADTGCSGVSVGEGPRELRKATRQICALGHGSAGEWKQTGERLWVFHEVM